HLDAALQAAKQASGEAERIQHTADALAVYDGPLLPGHYDAWIAGEAGRLSEAYLQTARRLIRCLAKRKETARALDYARQAVTMDPLREEMQRDLMRLYAASGQRSAALQQYRELAQPLHAQHGVPP